MLREQIKPSVINPEGQTEKQTERDRYKFLEKLAKSKLGRNLTLLGMSLAAFAAAEGQAAEYKGVLTPEGKARLEKVRRQRARNIEEARKNALARSQIESYGMESLEDGRTLYWFRTKEGVEIKAVDPGETKDRMNNSPEEVDKPSRIKGPTSTGGFGKAGGSKFFGSGFKW